MDKLIALIPALPFLGFLINGLGFRKIPKSLAGAIGSLTALGAFLLSIFLLVTFKTTGSQPFSTNLWTWINGSFFTVSFSFYVDQLTLLMLMIVTGIGFLIHVFSIGYMHHDEGLGKFFAFLNLFLFSMLVLVMGGNLLMTFIGWEGVGLCSYLLIGFWNKTDAFNDAAKKAFVMNRIGDLGFLLGIFIILFKVGTIQYIELSSLITNPKLLSDPLIQWAGICLFVGAMGKSAQIPLFTWLPDAMAGPTPVSALIHAATMVTSGIYLVIRMNGLFSGLPQVQELILWVGLATAILGALIGTSQNDIKKVLAYSTVSQLGFMFVALGVGAYTAAIFHVITHAFFKALLFLGAGSVIHGLHEEQDIRKMGGLKKFLPVTYFTFFMANLAIAGIPPFSGFFSKDEILAHTYAQNKVAFALLLVTAGITAFYMFRLFFLVFFNEYRGKLSSEKIHDAPASMAIPLMVLAVLSVIGGFVGIPEVFHAPHLLADFLSPVLKPSEALATLNGTAHHIGHSEEWMVMGLSVLVALTGIGIAARFYLSGKKVPSEIASESGISKILEGKFFIDEIYNTLIVKPIVFIGNLFSVLVDILMVNLFVEMVGSATQSLGSLLRRTQTGKVGNYTFLMLGSILVFALYFFFIKF